MTATQQRRQPWMKFFWDDWRSDPNLRASSLAARGLWADMIGIMHNAQPYGRLLLNGRPMTLTELASQVGRPTREVKTAYDELGVNGVYSLDEQRVPYSRRMVRRAAQQHANRLNGGKGAAARWGRRSDDGETNGETNGESDSEIIATAIANGIDPVPEARGQIPQPPAGMVVDEAIAERAGRFLDAYPGIYAKCRNGAFYRVKPVRDYSYACELVQSWPDVPRLLRMAEVFLKRTDLGPKSVPGTVGQFAHIAPDCDRLLREHGQ